MRKTRRTAAAASSTGTVIDVATQLLNYFPLERNALINPNREALSVEAALFRAATGRIPNAFTSDPDRAELLIATNETVQDALRWISAVLPTDPPHDPETGIDNHLEHIRTWVSTEDFFTGELPEVFTVVGVMRRAKQAADTLAAPPAARTAA